MAGMSDINIKYDLLSPGEAANSPKRISGIPKKEAVASAQPKSVFGTGLKPSYTEDGPGSLNNVPDRLKNSFFAGLEQRNILEQITFQQDDKQADDIADQRPDVAGELYAELATEEVVNEEL